MGPRTRIIVLSDSETQGVKLARAIAAEINLKAYLLKVSTYNHILFATFKARLPVRVFMEALGKFCLPSEVTLSKNLSANFCLIPGVRSERKIAWQ